MRVTSRGRLARPSWMSRCVMWAFPDAPRRVRLGFMFGPAGPGGPVELRSVQVTARVPWCTEEIELDFEVEVDNERVSFGQPWAEVG